MLAFLGTFLQPLLNFFGGPVVKGAVDAYKAKLEAGNNADRIAADIAGKELLLEQREAELQTQWKIATIGRWYEPDHLFGYIAVIYVGKVVLIDKVLAWGSTDPIKGDVGVWFGWIMAFWLGKRGFENVARILKR